MERAFICCVLALTVVFASVPVFASIDIQWDEDSFSVSKTDAWGNRATLTALVRGYWPYGKNYYIYSYHKAVCSAENPWWFLATGFARSSPLYMWARALKDDGTTVASWKGQVDGTSIDKWLYYEATHADIAQTKARVSFDHYTISERTIIRGPPTSTMVMFKSLDRPLFLLLLMTSSLTSRAPLWLSVGTYVKYEAEVRSLLLTNSSEVRFPQGSVAMFEWRCVDIRGEVAALDITFEVRIGDEVKLSRRASIAVDINDGTVLVNGTELGHTLLWIPSRLKKGVELNLPLGRTFGSFVFSSVRGEVREIVKARTAYYGIQKAMSVLWELSVWEGASKSTWPSPRLYDYDTGLLLQFPNYDITLLVLGIAEVYIPVATCNVRTNADLGPAELDAVTIFAWLLIVTIVTAIAGIALKRVHKRASTST